MRTGMMDGISARWYRAQGASPIVRPSTYDSTSSGTLRPSEARPAAVTELDSPGREATRRFPTHRNYRFGAVRNVEINDADADTTSPPAAFLCRISDILATAKFDTARESPSNPASFR
jgi:hypothetical protein